jgi:hypothetical protein
MLTAAIEAVVEAQAVEDGLLQGRAGAGGLGLERLAAAVEVAAARRAAVVPGVAVGAMGVRSV